MPIQGWNQVIGVGGGGGPVHRVDGTALGNSSVLTDISPVPNITIPANALYEGQAIRVNAWGRVSTTSTPTLNLGVYWGAVAGTAIMTSGAITTTSGVTNVPWHLEGIIVVRSNPSASNATLFGQGWVHGVSGTVGVSVVPLCSAGAATPAVVTVDTTTAKALTVGATWGTSSASNTITCHLWTIEVMN